MHGTCMLAFVVNDATCSLGDVFQIAGLIITHIFGLYTYVYSSMSIYIYILPGTYLSSIFGLQPSKTRPAFQSKRGFLGSRYLYLYLHGNPVAQWLPGRFYVRESLKQNMVSGCHPDATFTYKVGPKNPRFSIHGVK